MIYYEIAVSFRAGKLLTNQDAVVPNQLRPLHRLPALKENQNRQTPASSAIFYGNKQLCLFKGAGNKQRFIALGQ